MRNITNKRAEIELQSRSKYSTVRINDPNGIIAKACSTHKFQLWTKTLLSCRTFSTVYRIISKISLRRKKSNCALSLKWNGTASNSNITDKSPDGYMVVKHNTFRTIWLEGPKTTSVWEERLEQELEPYAQAKRPVARRERQTIQECSFWHWFTAFLGRLIYSIGHLLLCVCSYC